MYVRINVHTYGRQVDEIWVGLEIFKIPYRLNYLGFYFV